VIAAGRSECRKPTSKPVSSSAVSIAGETKTKVRSYKEDDCRSTASLRGWLEGRAA
jgi:hypothetical protein